MTDLPAVQISIGDLNDLRRRIRALEAELEAAKDEIATGDSVQHQPVWGRRRNIKRNLADWDRELEHIRLAIRKAKAEGVREAARAWIDHSRYPVKQWLNDYADRLEKEV